MRNALHIVLSVVAGLCALLAGCSQTKPSFVLVTDGEMGVRVDGRFYKLGDPAKDLISRYRGERPPGIRWTAAKPIELPTTDASAATGHRAEPRFVAHHCERRRYARPLQGASMLLYLRESEVDRDGGGDREELLDGVFFQLRSGSNGLWGWSAANARTDSGIGNNANLEQVEQAYGPPSDSEQEKGWNGGIYDLLVYERDHRSVVFRFDAGSLTAMGVIVGVPFAEGRGETANDTVASAIRAACKQGFAPAQSVMFDCRGLGFAGDMPDEREIARSLCETSRHRWKEGELRESPISSTHGADEQSTVKTSAEQDAGKGPKPRLSPRLTTTTLDCFDDVPLATEGFLFRNVGFFCLTGMGGEQSDTDAARSFRKSAELGSPRAQYNLGLCFALGRGVDKDQEQALSWWRRAASMEFARAQYRLGLCYESGDGVPADTSEALRWYRKAAGHGHREAREAARRLAPAAAEHTPPVAR